MAICAAFILPVIFAPLVPSTWETPHINYGLWIAATLIGFAAAAHQGFSSNLFTTTSDMFPKRAVGSINSLGGVAGACGSVILQSVAGVTLEITGSYVILFIIAGCAYPISLLLIHLCVPRLEPVTDAALESTRLPRAISAFVFAVLGLVVAVPASYLFQNKTAYYPYDGKTLVTMTFNDMVNALPPGLATASLTFEKNPPPQAPTPRLTLKLKREPTPAEAAEIAQLKAFPTDAYEKAQAHIPPGFTFSEYIAAVLPPGNIFANAGGSDRSHLLPPLLWTPLGGIGLGALLGALLHGILFKQRPRPT